jgi:hypothetical protein
MNKIEGWSSKQEKIWFQAGVSAENMRITAKIDEFIENTDYPEVEDALTLLKEVIKGEQK